MRTCVVTVVTRCHDKMTFCLFCHVLVQKSRHNDDGLFSALKFILHGTYVVYRHTRIPMSIMSTSAVHRRGKTASVSSKNHNHSNGAQDDHHEHYDKRSKPLNLEPILIAFLIALALIMGITFILPEDSGTNKPVETPSRTVSDESQNIRRGQEQQQAEGQEDMAKIPPDTGGVVHQMVFSTGCTTFQDWQSYIFFYHAWKAGQPGHVTRIASGCSPKEAKELKQLFQEQIAPMSERFHLHLTPDFMEIKPGKRYKFANKPHGLRHWLEHALGYPKNTKHDDDIVILLDPDQMLLRPLTNNFENSVVDWKPTKDHKTPITRVEHGSPAGQLYGFGAQWKTKVDISHVAGPNSPIEKVTMQEARDHYPLGPPYMATAKDMYTIADDWCKFLPKVHDNYPHLLAEMFAYSLSAAHNRLPHQVSLYKRLNSYAWRFSYACLLTFLASSS